MTFKTIQIRAFVFALFCCLNGSLNAETVVPLYSFSNGIGGAGPSGGLLEAKDGNLYGTTSSGGTNGFGTVFRITKSGNFNALYSFTNGIDGRSPVAGLIQAQDGNLYGTAGGGGSNLMFGTVFKITTNGVMTPLYSFTGGADGAIPFGGLVQASDGYLYGTTFGGTVASGNVYRISTSGQFKVIYTFTGGVDGAKPEQVTLIQARDGNLYGTTSKGGTNGFGTLFRITTGGYLTSLYSFSGGADGSKPVAGLTEGSDGYLYGTASQKGSFNLGTAFRISLGGDFKSLYSFSDTKAGSPTSNLIEMSDGFFYGTSYNGVDGTIFGINAASNFKLIYRFTAQTGGGCPAGIGLIRGSDANLYGVCSIGGTNLYGTVFRVSGVPTSPQPVQIQSPRVSGGNFGFAFPTSSNRNYAIEMNTNLVSPQWMTLSNVIGSGASFQFSIPMNRAPSAYFRIRQL